MGKVDERNQNVSNILNSLIAKAKDTTYTVDETSYKTSMDKLFTTDAWGFREIILVVVVGMKMDKAYKASTGLYDCNPRAIYEGPIKEFLIKNNIPHRKSGPLNIAKAAKGRNAVLIEGNGALVFGNTEGDIQALEIIMDKGCAAVVDCDIFNRPHYVPKAECFLMRTVYLAKYSKQIDE